MRDIVSGRPSYFCLTAYLRAFPLVLSIFLAKAGTQVIVPFRDEDEKRHLKVMGDLGQIVPLVRSISEVSQRVQSVYAHSFR